MELVALTACVALSSGGALYLKKTAAVLQSVQFVDNNATKGDMIYMEIPNGIYMEQVTPKVRFTASGHSSSTERSERH